MTGYRGRELSWLPVVRFHKDVVTRAEEGFFSLYGRDDHASRISMRRTLQVPGRSIAKPFTASHSGWHSNRASTRATSPATPATSAGRNCCEADGCRRGPSSTVRSTSGPTARVSRWCRRKAPGVSPRFPTVGLIDWKCVSAVRSIRSRFVSSRKPPAINGSNRRHSTAASCARFFPRFPTTSMCPGRVSISIRRLPFLQTTSPSTVCGAGCASSPGTSS